MSMNTLLEIMTQFAGGTDPAASIAVRYLLPAFFWASLGLVSFVHLRANRDDRDRHIAVAATVGLSRELLLFWIEWGSAHGWVRNPALHRIVPPLDHAMTLTSSAMVCYAFMRCILRWDPLPRKLFAPLAGGIALLFGWLFAAWLERLASNPEFPFDQVPGHLLLHVVGSFLLAGLLAAALSELLWGRRRVPFVLLPAITFPVCGEALMVVSRLGLVEWPDAVTVPIRANLHLWSVPLFIGVYWRELRSRMEESEKTRAGLFELSPAMLCMAEFDGHIRYASPASLRILGMSPGSLTGRLLSEFCRPSAPVAFDLASIREARETIQVEAPYEFPGEHSPRWLHWTFRAEPRSRRIFVLAADATVQKRAHDTLLRSEEALRNSHKMEAVGRLAGGIAHDFNNLLTAILGYCELSKAHADDPARILGDVEEIRKSAERAAALTRQLLAFSRRQHLQPRVMDLNERLMAMDSLLRRLIGEDIELVTRPGDGLRKVKADPGQIEQVIVNLVVNARDAMPGGGKILLSTRDLGREGLVALEVRDSGCGMDPETAARVFEPFFTTKEVGKGTGLGLSTVYGIVQQSGGSIRVSSTPGVGSAFVVTLPVAIEQPDLPQAPAAPADAPMRGRERILLVEDEDAVRDMVSESLQRHGYEVEEAPDGLKALEVYKTNPEAFDMVLTDVVMPGMSGGELAAALRRIDPSVKVLFMSGYSDDALVSRGVSRDGMAFLEKPFTQDALSKKVRGVLESPAARVPELTLR
jgi:PAS domain S-box-containing protein